jgi:ribosomal-protein-alanine N-acetyltransferase
MILCENTEVKEGLRHFIGAKDFFTEVRSLIPEKIITEAARKGEKIENRFNYNLFDTYKIVRLENLQDMDFDTGLITRMKESDLAELEAISKKVYKVRSRSWIRAQYRSGDIGFVARLDGKIIGFAFTTYANGHGRIHTLTVLPEYQNRGIGKELMRARLKALYDLGAVDVIAEIANWNLPSLQIAYRHGFKPAGAMYVETVRPQRIKRSIVRR